MPLDRRKKQLVITALAVTCLGALLSGPLQVPTVLAQPPVGQVRLKWQEFVSDPRRLQSFVKAVQVMRSNDSKPRDSADYRRSWQYWGAMHSYFGPRSRRGTVADARARLQASLPQFVGFFEGVPDLAAPDALALEVWDQCAHSRFPNGQFVQAENFFGWHRMYLYYFERVLRWAAQDDTLRLPYWDYTDPAQLGLPKGFGLKQDGEPENPALFDFRRTQGLNEGSVVVNELLTDVDADLPNPLFLGQAGFSAAIELGVHGNIHCAVGNTCPVPLMGSVIVSANDPVFWLHHANIDRLWECWMQSHGRPTGPWQSQAFTFVDETGQRQNEPVQKWVDPSVAGYKVDYTYDHVTQCERATTAGPTTSAPVANASPRAMAAVARATRIKIDKPITKVSLALAAPESRRLMAAPATEPRSIELVLHEVGVADVPGVLVNVYLAPAADATEQQFVGTLNFFGLEHAGHGTFTRRYDVTKQLHALRAGRSLRGVTVVFEVTSGLKSATGKTESPSGAAPAARLNPKARLRIGKVELYVAG